MSARFTHQQRQHASRQPVICKHEPLLSMTLHHGPNRSCLKLLMTLPTHSSSRRFSGALQMSASLEIAVYSSFTKCKLRQIDAHVKLMRKSFYAVLTIARLAGSFCDILGAILLCCNTNYGYNVLGQSIQLGNCCWHVMSKLQELCLCCAEAWLGCQIKARV